MDGPVRYETSAGRATITLDRPEAKNSLSAELVDQLARHLDSAIADPSIRVVVITNTGNTFCAGADLSDAASGSSPPDDDRRTFVDVFDLMLGSPKPVIGRIAGHCTGGGVGLAAACDVSVVSEDALIGFTEVRLGVAPAIISVVCLPKLRRADALEMFVTGRRHTAARAVEVGLLNRVVPTEGLDAAVDDLVGEIMQCEPNAVAAAKSMVFEVPVMDRAEAFTTMTELSQRLFRSPEAAAGIAAFRERRPPPWVPDT